MLLNGCVCVCVCVSFESLWWFGNLSSLPTTLNRTKLVKTMGEERKLNLSDLVKSYLVNTTTTTTLFYLERPVNLFSLKEMINLGQMCLSYLEPKVRFTGK